MMLSVLVPLVVAICATNANSVTHWITAPEYLQPGSSYDISVNILNTTRPVTVEATLQSRQLIYPARKYMTRELAYQNTTIENGTRGDLSLYVGANTRCPDCRLKIRGLGGLEFEYNPYVKVSSTIVVILIQTDKAIYKPGQTVRFRVYTVYPNLQMYKGALIVEFKDPNDNKIKVLNETAGEYGVVEGSLNLSEQPQFGNWSISVKAQETGDAESQIFAVDNDDLPRFEVKIELPPFGLTYEESLKGKVTAKYTFGENVKGRVELHVGRDESPDKCGDYPATTQITFDIDGEKSFEIPREDVYRAVRLVDRATVKVTAFVTETTTGVRLNGSSVITYYDKDAKVKFLQNTHEVFKPGLSYTAYIQVTTPDGLSPPEAITSPLSVYTSATTQIILPDQALYYVSKDFTGTIPLKGENVSLPANGVVPINVDIPSNAIKIQIQATFRGVHTGKIIEKPLSRSNNFLRLTLLDSYVQSASSISVKVEGTEPLGVVHYEVMARGSKVYVSKLTGGGQMSVVFELPVTSDMAPVARLLAYYTRDDGELVADSLAFDVAGVFNNKVTVGFNRNECEPKQSVEVLLTASPRSKVNILAVDQSGLLLKSDNDVTLEKVVGALSAFDHDLKKPLNSAFALSYSSKSVKDVFRSTGLMVITDLDFHSQLGLYEIRERSYYRYHSRFYAPHRRPEGSTVKRIRNVFPETWMWDNVNTGENGTASLMSTVPDTITSWVVSAVATDPTTGLGVAPTTAKLEVFRPFFISLNYPSIVTRGEQVVVQATIFNYLSADVNVDVKLKGNEFFKNILIDASETQYLAAGDREIAVQVQAGEQGVVYFPILTTQLGSLEIRVTARSSIAADAVRRLITVQPEGAQVSYVNHVFINVDDNSNFESTINFTLPPSTVDGSEKARVKVTGDLIRSSFHLLSTLLELPTGCGEQSMVKFAPDLYIAQYLRASGQLTSTVEAQIKEYLAVGYQRQLTYQRHDKSFSAFGSQDPVGSSWLTAMVAGAFVKAADFIYIDMEVVDKAIAWLLDRQSSDGSFKSFGKVLDPNTQISRTREGLTAYIFTSIFGRLQAHSNYPIETKQFWSWYNSTASAMSYLESRVIRQEITDTLSLAMVSYALAVAKSNRAQKALDQLVSKSNSAGGLVYWEDGSSRSSNSGTSESILWQPPVLQDDPANILVTSYAVLAMTAMGKVEEAFPSVQWLLTQRNPNGGFASSQDTTVGLQALAAYATASTRPETDLTITVDNRNGEPHESVEHKFFFNVRTAIAGALQVVQFSNFPAQANVQASGRGFALLEMVYSFHVTSELSTPSFDVSTVLLDDDLDSFNLMVCTKWLLDRDTGMVVQEISIPSGFQPDLSTLGNVAGLERSERRGNTVAVYFDRISKSSLCYSLIMTRTAKVAHSQISFVRTFDYYKPSDQSTIFYRPRKLGESTVCDICNACCHTEDQEQDPNVVVMSAELP